jgi:uncharacterized protein (TIGR03435 family)
MKVKCIPILCFAGLILTKLFGQNPGPLLFEVASVRRSDPNQRAVDFVISAGGRLRVTNMSLAEMIHQAYQVKYYQVSGGPGWVNDARFNIEAKATEESTRKELMAMLQNLLVDRFQLRIRREQREGKVFELVISKGVPKLKPSKADSSYLRLERNTPPELPGVSYTIVGQKISMAKLADGLMGHVERPVLDRTEIAGEFDFRIDYAIEGRGDVGPSIFTALQEQLGLRLQTAKGPIETLVSEKAERPTAN